MRTVETPVQAAERILPQIDSIFVGGNAALSPPEAAKLVAKGEAALRELELSIRDSEISVSTDEEVSALKEQKRLYESLKTSIALAKEET